MIVSVFIRRLKPGATFEDFVREWGADEGFGVPTRVFNAQSLTDPREIISIGFVAVGTEELAQWLSAAPASEAVRHERIDSVSVAPRHTTQYFETYGNCAIYKDG
jgi:hypothetical protein